MPTPTLYDNFSQVRQYMDQEKPDLSSYVTKSELSSCSYITSDVKELTGPLYITYQETNNALYGLKSYSHIVAGDENKTTPAFIGSKRYCVNGVGSYVNMASFFVNSDGRAKFAHKASAGTGGDDSFMCFNAYGFKVAYSGAAGTSASTEYEILHEGNVGNYITPIDENIIPKENNTYTLGNSTYLYKEAYISNIYTTEFNRIYSSSNYNYYFQINGANRFYMDTIGFYGNADGARNLGSSTNNFGSTYTNNLYSNYTYIGGINYLYNTAGGGLVVNRNGSNICAFLGGGNIGISPTVNNGANLGNSDQMWKATYTNSLYLDNSNIKDLINGMFSYDSTTGTLTITTIS